jgi:hypothetical protein
MNAILSATSAFLSAGHATLSLSGRASISMLLSIGGYCDYIETFAPRRVACVGWKDRERTARAVSKCGFLIRARLGMLSIVGIE